MDKDKIILMTRFAIYDKRFGKKDQKANEYFENDYIYIKNSWTRFFVFIGCLFIIACRWLYVMYFADGNIFALDLKKEIVSNAVFVGVTLASYTLISSKIALEEYNKARARVKNYYAILAQLGHTKGNGEEDSENGTTAYISQNAD